MYFVFITCIYIYIYHYNTSKKKSFIIHVPVHARTQLYISLNLHGLYLFVLSKSYDLFLVLLECYSFNIQCIYKGMIAYNLSLIVFYLTCKS
jgi:hypothetical protein